MDNLNLKNINIQDFEKLFKKYYAELCGYAVKYTKNKQSSEEIVQNVFYKIWEKRSFINVKISVKAYLYVSVRNLCLQKINRDKITDTYMKYLYEQDNTEIITPYDSFIFNETKEIFNDVLNSLSQRCSEIFILSRFEGLKYAEIADRLEISVKTVEANISKALKIFRTYFPEYS